MVKIIIAAVATNGVIGRLSGEMPWLSKEEFQHFRNTTLGHPIIMGRKTFESLGKPLKGRLNIVLSKQRDFMIKLDEVVTLNSLIEAYEYCKEKNYTKIFIIGGGQIFPEAMKSADEMIISIMKFPAKGDVYFPVIDPNIWNEVNREERSEFIIITYVKKI